MSNAIHRVPPRGKPTNQDHNVINIPPSPMSYGQGQFVTPLVPQTGDFRTEFPVGTIMQPAGAAFQQPYRQYTDPAPVQQYFPTAHGYRADYNYYPFAPNHAPPTTQPYTENVPYQQPLPQLPAQSQPVRPREKKILSFVDPESNETIVLPAGPGGAATSTKTENPQTIEKKSQTRSEFLDKVKSQLKSDSENSTPVEEKKVEPPKKIEEKAIPTVVEEPIKAVPKKTIEIKEASPVEQQTSVEQQPPVELQSSVKVEEEEHEEKSLRETTPVNIEETETVTPASVTPTTTVEESPEVVEKTPEEIAKDETEKAAAEVEIKRQREIELDRKKDEYLESDVDLEKKQYGRNFMVTMRDIQRELKRTPCPLTPFELAEFGLDIKTMMKNERGKTNFQPSWAAMNKTRGNNSYRGRTTTDGTGRGGPRQDRGVHKKPPVIRGSIERVQKFTLATSKDAWKPDRQKSTTDEDLKKKDICKKVRSLMNKITPTSKEELIKEFISYNVSSDEKQLVDVVNIIFDKAVEEPKFCALYAEVCKAQVNHEVKKSPESKSTFRNTLLTRSQDAFHDRSLEKISSENADSAAVLEERMKFRRRKFGNMTFIGHLYRYKLLSTKIAQSCIYDLLQTIVMSEDLEAGRSSIDEESIHCALKLIETLGSILDSPLTKDSSPLCLDQWFVKLNDAKPYCSNKIKFMIMNLIELRENKWVPRKSVEVGPKKIDEIHNDVRQEQIEKERQRDQYDRKHTGIRTNSNSLRKQMPVSRGSIERNKNLNPENKRAAAAATTKLAGSSIQPKNISLSQMNDTTLGASKPKWQSGSSGGGNSTTVVEPPKNAWGARRDSNDQRKKSTVDERQSVAAVAKNVDSRRSTSQNSSEDRSDVGEISEERKAALNKIMNTIKTSLEEYVAGDLKKEEFLEDFFKIVDSPDFGKPTLPMVYSYTIRSASEKVFNDEKMKILAQIVRSSLTNKKIKQAFIDGVVRFVKEIVEGEEWEDFPKIWSITGNLLLNISHLTDFPSNVEVLSTKDFEPVFLAAKTGIPGKNFILLVEFLKKLAEKELADESMNEHADIVSWEYQELSIRQELEKEGFLEELEKCSMGGGKTLKSVLKV